MSVFKSYTKAMHKEYGTRATWLPGTKISIGDVGVLHDGKFVPQSSLKDLGIDFEVIEEFPMDYDYVSSQGVNIHKKLAGQAAPVQTSALGQADAGLVVEFKKEGAIVFSAKNGRKYRLKNSLQIGMEIEKRYEAGQWKKEWLIVSEVIIADNGTILISQSSNVNVELKAKGQLGAGDLKLSNLDLDFASQVDASKAITVKADQGLTPLYNLSGIRAGWFSKGKFVPKSADGRPPEGAEPADVFNTIPLTEDEVEGLPED